jgi:anti-sigma-K factor RskA
MTQLEFEAGLDRWGADLARWPPEAAAQAHTRLAADPQARQALAAAAAVDGYLHGLREDTAPQHLERQILARLERTERAAAPASPGTATRMVDWLTQRLWRPALLALVPLFAGFLIGHGSVPLVSTQADAEVVVDAEVAAAMATLAFSDLYAEFDDAQW